MPQSAPPALSTRHSSFRAPRPPAARRRVGLVLHASHSPPDLPGHPRHAPFSALSVPFPAPMQAAAPQVVGLTASPGGDVSLGGTEELVSGLTRALGAQLLAIDDAEARAQAAEAAAAAAAASDSSGGGASAPLVSGSERKVCGPRLANKYAGCALPSLGAVLVGAVNAAANQPTCCFLQTARSRPAWPSGAPP